MSALTSDLNWIIKIVNMGGAGSERLVFPRYSGRENIGKR
jgi:hypothetical protein